MKKPISSEKDVKELVKRALAKFGNKVWHFMPVQGGFGAQGIPDFICCVGGTFFAIETKFNKNGLSAWQIKQMNGIRTANGMHYVIDETNVYMVEEFITAVLGLGE